MNMQELDTNLKELYAGRSLKPWEAILAVTFIAGVVGIPVVFTELLRHLPHRVRIGFDVFSILLLWGFAAWLAFKKRFPRDLSTVGFLILLVAATAEFGSDLLSPVWRGSVDRVGHLLFWPALLLMNYSTLKTRFKPRNGITTTATDER